RGGNASDPLTLAIEDRVHVDHLVVDVRADAWSFDLDADELALWAFGLDSRERLLADEVGLLLKVHHPRIAHVDLEGVRVVPDVAAERENPCLDTAHVAWPGHQKVVRLTGFQHRVPQLDAVLRGVVEVDLV